jgi:hypothetical protein
MATTFAFPVIYELVRGKDCGQQRNPDGAPGAVQGPQGLQPLREDDGRHDVVADQAHQDGQQGDDDTAVTELRARLDHLREAEFRTL